MKPLKVFVFHSCENGFSKTRFQQTNANTNTHKRYSKSFVKTLLPYLSKNIISNTKKETNKRMNRGKKQQRESERESKKKRTHAHGKFSDLVQLCYYQSEVNRIKLKISRSMTKMEHIKWNENDTPHSSGKNNNETIKYQQHHIVSTW